jgi:WhiB family redox-sensing transcriptional regulator
MEDWLTRAACRGEDPQLFDGTLEGGRDVAQAKAVCARCPVRVDCLTDALELRDDTTVRAGMTAAERREYLRRARERGTRREAVAV